MPISSGSGYYSTNYKMDRSLFRSRFLKFWFAIMWVAIVAFPFLFSGYTVHLIILVALASIGALALNLVTGYTGLISLGQAGFLCAGAFSSVIFGLQAGLPFVLVVPLAGVVGALFGLLAGLPALRLKGLYLALSTVAMHYIITFICCEYQSKAHAGYVTGFSIPTASIGALALDSTIKWYFFLVIITALFTTFCINLERSRLGRALQAVRDRDIAASALGVNIGFYKVLIFAFSSAIVAMAGSLSAYYMSYTSVEEYSLWLGIMYVAMIIIGGMGSIMGSFLGAFFVTLLPYGLSALFDVLPVPAALQTYFFAVQFALFGFFIVLFLLVEPTGLVGIWRRIRNFFELWPFRWRRVISVTR